VTVGQAGTLDFAKIGASNLRGPIARRRPRRDRQQHRPGEHQVRYATAHLVVPTLLTSVMRLSQVAPPMMVAAIIPARLMMTVSGRASGGTVRP
jgi:hypothetical protein